MPEETPTHQSHVRADSVAIVPRDPAPEVRPIANPDGHGQVVVHHKDYVMERLDGRKRGLRRHVFDDIRSLAEYLNRHAKDRETTEILVSETAISAALDPSKAECDQLTCRLTFAPEFTAWRDSLDQSLSQKDMNALIRANRESVEDEETRDLLLSSLRTLKVTGGTELDLQIDELGYTRFAAGSEKKHVTGKIPPTFVIRVPIFEGVEQVFDTWNSDASYQIELLLYVETERGVTFRLEAPSLPRILRQARRDAAKYLDHLLDDEFLVGLGELKATEVPARA